MYMDRIAGGTYVQISREELEDWLNDIGFRSKWKRDPRFAGIYILELSSNVGIKLSSTISGMNEAVDRARGSMQLALVSIITGRVLNKKAQGQSHFARTKGWKKNWAAGIKVMKDAYLNAAAFYDTIAPIDDREKYKTDNLKLIESIPGWSSNNYFIALHRKIDQGGVLMPNDRQEIEAGLTRPAARPDPQRVPGVSSDEDPSEIDDEEQRDRTVQMREDRINALRTLWVKANRWQPNNEQGQKNKEWVMGFAKSIGEQLKAGRSLTPSQVNVIRRNLDQWRITMDAGKPASSLF